MEISKTKIEKRLRKKTNPELVDTLIKLKKTNPEIAKLLAFPVKRQISKNLSDLNESDKDVVVPGKVLSQGDLVKKKKIVAWSASEKAIEKIKKFGGEFVFLKDEIKKNEKLNGLEIVR